MIARPEVLNSVNVILIAFDWNPIAKSKSTQKLSLYPWNLFC